MISGRDTGIERNEKIIDSLEISDTQKELIKSAWLDYLKLTNRNATLGVRYFHILQVTVIITGILIPVLETSSLQFKVLGNLGIIGILGLTVAIATGLTRHFSFEERWRHYRQHAELIRNEGDDYFALSNNYSECDTHAQAFKEFIAAVTNFKRQEIQSYMIKNNKSTKNQNKKSSG
jgi:hypothetical protein